MARDHGIGEFDEELTLEAPFGVVFHIHRRGDTFDGDGGANRHGWHWSVTVGDMEMDADTGHDFTGWTDGYGFRHDGFPTREDAYDHMGRHAKTPKEYSDDKDAREEQGRRFREAFEDGSWRDSTGMGSLD